MTADGKREHSGSGTLALGRAKRPRSLVSRVRTTLSGPITDIFHMLIPELEGMDSFEIYEVVMHDPVIAEKCVKLFRARRELFSSFLLNKEGQMITSDEQALPCGRSVEQVIALVVRAVAKRHFRDRLNRPPIAPLSRPKPGPFAQALDVLLRPSGAGYGEQRRKPPGDALFDALSDHLRFEWQIPLVPHYAPLKVSTVKALGERILDYREPEQLKELARSGPQPGLKPADTAKGAGEGAKGAPKDGKAPKGGAVPGKTSAPGVSKLAELMWRHSQALELPNLFGVDEREMRDRIAHIAGVSPAVQTAMSKAAAGLPQLVVVLCALDHSLGHQQLLAKFGAPPDMRLVKDLTAMLIERKANTYSSAPALREVTEFCLKALKMQGHQLSL